MSIIRDLSELKSPIQNPVLTIGNFDGVHRGHLALFDKVKQIAKEINGLSVVMTFDPHPIKVLSNGNGPPVITPTPQKLRLIKEAGIDIILCLPFTKEFATISAKDFVEKILVQKIGVKYIVVGYDYAFGKNRQGNIEFLKKMAEQYGFKVEVVNPVSINGTIVSSTKIRNLVQEGKLEEAKILLGRNYQVTGTVIKGKNRGTRILGYPTANLKLIDELTPKTGVYAVKVHIDNKVYKGVANIGYNPTFGNGAFSVETHIIGFDKNILGKEIRVEFVKRLRDEKKFKSPSELAEQIKKDIQEAQKVLDAV
ncbi:MAG: riboflavin biosynthesis protein RibF [Deltaproteobacteria bacterium]|nr:MAG: riboflavin biosynthesis protein RibF [Deltaproteobacteria bacterium]